MNNDYHSFITTILHHCLLGAASLIFIPIVTRTFTKDTALSEYGKGAAWHVWINGRASWQGNGMGTACYVWIGLKGPEYI